MYTCEDVESSCMPDRVGAQNPLAFRINQG